MMTVKKLIVAIVSGLVFIVCSGFYIAQNSSGQVQSLVSTTTDVKPCRYYAYILYGNAALVKDIKKYEKVYSETRIFKSEEGFSACCNDYCSNSCAGFSIKNIGPYETEAICYLELQKQLNLLTSNNYKPYKKGDHMIIGVLERNYKPCN